jgi:hypothetical protein
MRSSTVRKPTRVVAVPDGQVCKGTQLREILVVEEHEALKNVALNPEVSVDVERLDNTLQNTESQQTRPSVS